MKKYLKYILILFTLMITLILGQTLAHASSLTCGILTSQNNYNSTSFDKELAEKIGKERQQHVKFKVFKTHTQMLQALKKRKIDLALGISPTELPHSLDASEPYLYIKNILFSLNDYSLTKLQGKKIGVLSESGQNKLIQDLGMKPESFSSPSALVSALDDHHIKAALLNQYQYNTYLNEHVDRQQTASLNNFSLTSKPFEKISDHRILAQQLVIATNNKKLARQLTKLIHKMRMDTTLTKLSVKYYHYDYVFK